MLMQRLLAVGFAAGLAVTTGLLLAGAATQPAALSGAPGTAAAAPADPLQTLAGSKYTDVGGNIVALGHGQSEGTAAMVFVFINVECPISNKLAPELNRLAKLAGQRKMEFYGVLSDPAVSRSDGQKHSKDYSLAFPVLFDASGSLAAALKPAVTPECFVVSPVGKIVYSGRVNDSYAAVGKPKGAPASNDLEDAIVAVAAGKSPAAVHTEAVGCVFESWKHEDKAAKVTWSRDIAPIVYANCSTCHHQGEVAPFALMSYKEASKRADMLAEVTTSKLMPPWKLADGWGKFHDERRLTDAQIALLSAWAKAGAPEGNPADAPAPPKFDDGWKLGTPDMVVKMPRAYQVPAEGRDLMTYTIVPLDIPEDKYVIGFEYRPGNRSVVHHMIALLDSRGAARKVAKDKGDGTSYISFGGPGFTPTGGLGGWAPGATPRFLPDGIGRPLKKGSDLILQVHYHATGKPETDQGTIALYFAKKPVQQVAINFPLMNRKIDIPAGNANYILTQQITTPVDVTLFGITPHMHNLGREMKVTATFPDGHDERLIYVNDWDWNWQDQYQLTTPIKLPRGTKISLWARYDNSADNPRNPNDPPRRVTFGEQTTNEMCIAFLQITVDGLKAPLLGAAAGGDDGAPAIDRAAIRARLQQLNR